MIARREVLGISTAAMISCARSDGAYFGSIVPPKTRGLVHTLPGEVETLDPAKYAGDWGSYVIPALFEGLTEYHPGEHSPMAALATHYEVNATSTQFRFFLRGHPNPRGIRLPGNAKLPKSFLQGRRPSPDSVRAYWSDGVPIRAYDFVYSWRRLMNPRTAATFAFQLTLLRNGQDVLEDKRQPHELGVYAPDEFTFVVELRSSTPFFLEFITGKCRPVPMHAVEEARKRNSESTWTEPAHIVTSGPFMLRERRPYERIVLTRNPRYYDASLVHLDELTFLPVVDGTTVINLYKTGDAAVTPGAALSPLFAPVLSRKKDYYSAPAFATRAPSINVRRTPFDNVLLRYALNMATEKKAVAALYGPTYLSARSFTAPSPGYKRPDSLKIDVDGRQYDVLSFDVEGARSLLAKAGFPGGTAPSGSRLTVPYHFPILVGARPQGEILEQQWLHNLNIYVKLLAREFNVHARMVLEQDYNGAEQITRSGQVFWTPTAFSPISRAMRNEIPRAGLIQVMPPSSMQRMAS